MYRVPSRRKQKKQVGKPNLIPILDAVFIFIFFLLMSANFIKIFEIPSPIPLVSSGPPPKDAKPLALTLRITNSGITVYTGVPSVARRSFGKDANGDYELEPLHNYLISLKKSYLHENSVIFEPVIDIDYEKIVIIMDAVRILRKTDPAIFIKDKDGLDKKLDVLFSDIVFGNIQS